MRTRETVDTDITLYERRVFSSIDAFRLGLYINKCILNRINKHNISLGITWKSSSICCKTSSRIHECRMWIRMKKKEAVRIYLLRNDKRDKKRKWGNYFFIKIEKIFDPEQKLFLFDFHEINKKNHLVYSLANILTFFSIF